MATRKEPRRAGPRKIDPAVVRMADELRERARQLHELAKGGHWSSPQKSLDAFERTVRAAWKAAMPRWRQGLVHEQIVRPIAIAGANIAAGNGSLESWTPFVINAIKLVCSDPAAGDSNPATPTRATVTRAIEACVDPRRRGAPRKSDNRVGRDEAVFAVLKELRVTGGTKEAVRKLFERSIPLDKMRAATREHLASVRE